MLLITLVYSPYIIGVPQQIKPVYPNIKNASSLAKAMSMRIINPVSALPFVMMFMWPIPLVWKTNTNAHYVTVVSPPEQIYAYMENQQPHIRAVDLLYL